MLFTYVLVYFHDCCLRKDMTLQRVSLRGENSILIAAAGRGGPIPRFGGSAPGASRLRRATPNGDDTHYHGLESPRGTYSYTYYYSFIYNTI